MRGRENSTAVVLMNLGGPDSLKAVRPFLYNLFRDPDILDLPLGKLIRPILARFISTKRAFSTRKIFEAIGGKSPLLEHTQSQAQALEAELNKKGDFKVYVAMRYWHPFFSATWKEIQSAGHKRAILIPLYPQYSVTTTGSSLHEWERVVRAERTRDVEPNESWRRTGDGADTSDGPVEFTLIADYHCHPLYVEAVVERIEEGLERFSGSSDEVYIIFSAHGVPRYLIERGDPYERQIRETAYAVMSRFGRPNPHLVAFQSKVGRAEWLTPATDSVLAELGGNGVTKVLVVPVSFVSEHSETLYELDIEYRQVAEANRISEYAVMPALNDSPTFIMALVDLVLARAGRE